MRQTPKQDVAPRVSSQTPEGSFLTERGEIGRVYKADRVLPKLRCPECNARLLDAGSVSVRRRTRLFLYKEGDAAQFVIKCRACGRCIGISEDRTAERYDREMPDRKAQIDAE